MTVRGLAFETRSIRSSSVSHALLRAYFTARLFLLFQCYTAGVLLFHITKSYPS